ncbi:hypothetical protein KB213_10790, partial [Neokomagataea sp. TBRC 2177]|nr:hypothetical protein [Neokomagataea anthophila]
TIKEKSLLSSGNTLGGTSHLYKKRHLIENMFAKLKDRRRVATRYDRCGSHIHVRYPYRSKLHFLPQRMSFEPRAHHANAGHFGSQNDATQHGEFINVRFAVVL